MTNKSVGFVYADAGWETLVNVAAERILWSRYEVPWTAQSIPPVRARFRAGKVSLVRAKLSASVIEDIKQATDAHGSARFRGVRVVAVDDSALREVAHLLRHFQGVSGWEVTAGFVGSFVRQFPVALQRHLVDQVLLRIQPMDRAHVVPVLSAQLTPLASIDAPPDILSLSPNSGEMWRSLIEGELRPLLGAGVNFRADALLPIGQGTGPVVLVDDLVASGSQARCQIQAWFGVPNNQWADPGERNIRMEPLSADQQTELRARGVTIVVAVGTPGAKMAIEAVAAAHGLPCEVRFAHPMNAAGLADVDEALVSELRRIGTALLVEHGRPDPAGDALGASGRTGLVVGMFNVPTCMPAALWCPGTLDGAPWVPLLIRRGYQRSAVIC